MRRDGLTGRRDGLTDRRDGLTDRRDGLTDRRDGLTDTRDGLTDRQDGLTDRRDGLTDRRDGLTDRRDGLTDRRDGLTDRRDGLTDRRDGLTDRQDGLTDRRDGLTDRRDGLTDRRDGLTDRRDGLTDRRDGLTDRRDGLTDRRDGLTDRQDGLTDRRDGLTDRRDEIFPGSMRYPVSQSPYFFYCLLLMAFYLASTVSSSPYKRINSEMRLRSARGFRDKVASLQTARNFGKRSSSTAGGYLDDGEGDSGVTAGVQGGAETAESLYNLIKENYSSDSLDRQFPLDWIAKQLQTNPYLIKLFLTEFVDSNKDGYLSADELTSSL
ncbi:hypothetical protein M8J75_011281 [Diaphorina citri]|nr:hypothetical protein M8J75_011281 [Diaphorina citri]